MIFGKLIGGLLGFFSFGLFGAIAGVAMGHFFDKGFGQALGFDYSGERRRLQSLFFETSFTVMGHLAKSDGRVSEEEISKAEELMARLGLTLELRQQAIDFFKRGASSDFILEPVIARFVSEGGRQRNLPVLLLEFLFSMAMADGSLHPAEKDILQRTATYLGMGSRQFEQLLSMLQAQQQFGGEQFRRSGQQRPRVDELEQAYQALGVSSTDSDKDIKRAYRKLMSQHHPDKLMSQGVPEEMIKVATERSQEIQVAYDLIKTARKS